MLVAGLLLLASCGPPDEGAGTTSPPPTSAVATTVAPTSTVTTSTTHPETTTTSAAALEAEEILQALDPYLNAQGRRVVPTDVTELVARLDESCNDWDERLAEAGAEPGSFLATVAYDEMRAAIEREAVLLMIDPATAPTPTDTMGAVEVFVGLAAVASELRCPHHAEIAEDLVPPDWLDRTAIFALVVPLTQPDLVEFALADFVNFTFATREAEFTIDLRQSVAALDEICLILDDPSLDLAAAKATALAELTRMEADLTDAGLTFRSVVDPYNPQAEAIASHSPGGLIGVAGAFRCPHHIRALESSLGDDLNFVMNDLRAGLFFDFGFGQPPDPPSASPVPGAPPTAEITISNNSFSPYTLTVTKGIYTEVEFINEDADPYEISFTSGIPDPVIVPAGGSVTVDISLLDPGIHRYSIQVGNVRAGGIIEILAPETTDT